MSLMERGDWEKPVLCDVRVRRRAKRDETGKLDTWMAGAPMSGLEGWAQAAFKI